MHTVHILRVANPTQIHVVPPFHQPKLSQHQNSSELSPATFQPHTLHNFLDRLHLCFTVTTVKKDMSLDLFSGNLLHHSRGHDMYLQRHWFQEMPSSHQDNSSHMCPWASRTCLACTWASKKQTNEEMGRGRRWRQKRVPRIKMPS